MKVPYACLPMLIAGALALAAPAAGVAATPQHAVYVAHLHAMNTGVSKSRTTGEARFTVDGDKLTISVKVHGAPPDTVHWQHFHGFKDGQPAHCATAADDTNHDGIVDLIETEKASGTTMVPFDTDPAAMDIAHGTYPKANAKGAYTYKETDSLKALDAAFAKQFPGQKLDLAKRVVYIHGVPSDTKLPGTVKSLGPIPAQVTLPIACARIERVSGTASH
ncbi:MAG: hypothetical protein ACREP2_03765 [Rhodanobacteraceae bacterium]